MKRYDTPKRTSVFGIAAAVASAAVLTLAVYLPTQTTSTLDAFGMVVIGKNEPFRKISTRVPHVEVVGVPTARPLPTAANVVPVSMPNS